MNGWMKLDQMQRKFEAKVYSDATTCGKYFKIVLKYNSTTGQQEVKCRIYRLPRCSYIAKQFEHKIGENTENWNQILQKG